MNNYYTYAYLREDGTPYYVGKGKGRRINSRKRLCGIPKDKNKIIFLKKNLTEEEAFRHEIYMIAVLGRKDLGTGILRNITDGGEGASGAIRTEEFKNKRRKINTGKKLSQSHIEKLRIANAGKNNPNYGKVASKETREKMRLSQKKHHFCYWWSIVFSDGSIVNTYGLNTWCKENGYNAGCVHMVYSGRRKSHKNILCVKRIPLNTYMVEEKLKQQQNG